MLNLELIFLFAIFSVSRARQVNITIDDREGAGGILAPRFFPPELWNTENCPRCWITPDPARAYGGTWREATVAPGDNTLSFTLNFKGIAVYIYLSCPIEIFSGQTPVCFPQSLTREWNRTQSSTKLDTMCTFFVDSEEGYTFSHIHDESTTEILYNQLAFSKTGLSPNEMHRLLGEIQPDEGNASWTAFDYAIVTVEEPDAEEGEDDDLSSTSSLSDGARIGAIVGSILGAIILLGLILFFWLRHWRRRRAPAPTVDLLSDPPLMEQTDTSIAAMSSSPESQLASHGSSRPDSFNPYSMVSVDHPIPSVAGTSNSGSPRGVTGSRTEPSDTKGHSSASDISPVSRIRTLRDARQRELERQVTHAKQALFAAQAASSEFAPSPSVKLREVEQNAATDTMNLRSQMIELQERIRQLEAAQSSTWAQGHSDHPPPGYTPSPERRIL